MYHGYCGPKRLFDPVLGRCIKTDPEICKPGYSDQIVSHEMDFAVNQNGLRMENYMENLTQKGPRIVCYVTSWAIYRKADGKFVPERLDSRLCTDVIYAFASLNPDTLLIQTFDPWADIENGRCCYQFLFPFHFFFFLHKSLCNKVTSLYKKLRPFFRSVRTSDIDQRDQDPFGPWWLDRQFRRQIFSIDKQRRLSSEIHLGDDKFLKETQLRRFVDRMELSEMLAERLQERSRF